MEKDKARTINAILTGDRSECLFESIRESLLRAITRLQTHVENTSDGYGLQVDLTKCDLTDRFEAVFTESGIVGIVEARDPDNVDMVTPSIGATADRCCGLVEASVAFDFVKCFR